MSRVAGDTGFLVGKPETKKPLGRWDDNIKIDLQER